MSNVRATRGGVLSISRASAQLLRRILSRASSIPPGRLDPQSCHNSRCLGLSVGNAAPYLVPLSPKPWPEFNPGSLRKAHKEGFFEGEIGNMSTEEFRTFLKNPGPVYMSTLDLLIFAIRSGQISPNLEAYLARTFALVLEYTFLTGYQLSQDFESFSHGERKKGKKIPAQLLAAAWKNWLVRNYHISQTSASQFASKAPPLPDRLENDSGTQYIPGESQITEMDPEGGESFQEFYRELTDESPADSTLSKPIRSWGPKAVLLT